MDVVGDDGLDKKPVTHAGFDTGEVLDFLGQRLQEAIFLVLFRRQVDFPDDRKIAVGEQGDLGESDGMFFFFFLRLCVQWVERGFFLLGDHRGVGGQIAQPLHFRGHDDADDGHGAQAYADVDDPEYPTQQAVPEGQRPAV